MKEDLLKEELEQLVLKFRVSGLEDDTIRKVLSQALLVIPQTELDKHGNTPQSLDLETLGAKVEKLCFGGVWDLDAEDDESRKILFIAKALTQRIYEKEGHLLRSMLNAVISVLGEAEEKGRFADSEIHPGQYSSTGQMSISYLNQLIKMNLEKERKISNPEKTSTKTKEMAEEGKHLWDDRYRAILRKTIFEHPN